MYDLNNFLATLLAAGGLGFSNYWILDHLGFTNQRNVKNTQQVLLYCLLFSLPDFAVFLVVQEILKIIPILQGNWFVFWSISITFIIVILLTLFLGKYIHSCAYWLINKVRVQNQNSTITESTPWQELAEYSNGKPQMAYIYDFNYHALGCGYVRAYSDNAESFSMNLIPFEDEDMEEQPSYQKFNQYIQSKDWQKSYKIYRHVNFNQNFILFIVIPTSSVE